jgi:threonyl-tRNA synthetase
LTDICITLKDGSIRKIASGTSIRELAGSLGRKLAESAVAGRIDGRLLDLDTRLNGDASLVIVTADDEEGLNILRHSTSHIMAAAVKRLYPETRVSIGPSIENGFYYDFDREDAFIPEDIPKIEKEMQDIINSNLPFERIEMNRLEAMELFENAGETYKSELLREIADEKISLYRTGDFLDLCRGPHIPSTGRVKAFKLLSIAGAYWRGDEKKKMLQRIYGTAFNKKDELEKHLHNIEEAARRDHRKLGRELDLFSIQEEAGPGLIFWHQKGAAVRRVVEDFWKDEHYRRGYELVTSPHIARAHLWTISGHLDFYKENMFAGLDIEGQEYILKPMNCPFHILIYKSARRSYRELPMRMAEMGTVYRYERSGVLHGMLRVRGFTQDDAHIFCTPEQLKEEIIGCVDLAGFMMKSFGFNEYEINLATRPEKFAGTPETWDIAENTLREALEEKNLPYVVDSGGAVFYGPKIDIKIKDALGRHWQGPTVQFDFNLPGRFNVTYIGSDGEKHTPFMVHRAMLGSFERFMGCLIEHYSGAFPVWLAPIQVRVMPITARNREYAARVLGELRKNNIRADMDDRSEKINMKIREGQVQKIPYMLILGEREEEAEAVAVRSRSLGDLGSRPLAGFIDILKEEVAGRKL